MTSHGRIALLMAAVAMASACRSKAEQKKEEAIALNARVHRLDARLVQADRIHATNAPVAMWLMPQQLREISGLALTTDGRLLAHDDEIGKIYEIDPRRGVILKSFMLGQGPRGDFEAITIAGSDIYLLGSMGILLRFREGANGAHVPYVEYDTRLRKECEFEGAVFERDSAWLVLPCKKVHDKNLKGQLVLFRWRIGSTDSSGISKMAVPLDQVIGANKWQNFRPSDITIDPATGNYVIISSLDRGLVVMTPDGEVVRSEPLPGRHNQAEGVAITRDSILIISDEATGKPAAITMYRWHRSAAEQGSL